MRNCSPHLNWEQEVLLHVSFFVKRLKFCGYSNVFRHNVLVKSIQKYDLRSKNFQEGKSYYILENERNKDNANSKHEWYKEGDRYESVLFVEATPESEYRRKVEALVKNHELKIKVVERVGQTILSPCCREVTPWEVICAQGKTALFAPENYLSTVENEGVCTNFRAWNAQTETNIEVRLVEVHMRGM